MVENHTQYLNYEGVYVPVRGARPGGERLEPVGAFTCAECVRNGATNVRVYRTKSAMEEHLASYHNKGESKVESDAEFDAKATEDRAEADEDLEEPPPINQL